MRPIRLSSQTIALYGLTSFVAVLATAELEIASRLASALVVSLVAVGIAAVLHGFVTRLVSLIAVAVAVGAVRGAVLVGVLTWFGEAERPDLLRVASSIISAVIWMSVIALAFAGRDEYRLQYAAAVREVAACHADAGLDALPEVVELKSALGAAVASTEQAPSEEALRSAAVVLRAEIEERVRPLSHRIWFSAGSLQPHARIGRLVRDAIVTFPVPVWPVAIVWALSSFIGAPVIYGPLQGVLSATVCGLVLLVCLLSARFVLKLWHQRYLGVGLFVASALLPVLVSVAVVDSLGYATSDAQMLATFILVPLATAALLAAGSAIALANADRAQILRIVEARARAVDPWPSVDVSSYLHNSLQSELAGLALQFDRARPGSLEAQVAVERLAAIASRSIADDFRAQRETPLLRLQHAAAAWRGIADVSVAVSPLVDGADPRLSRVVEGVAEVTSNAIRHGGARVVRATVEVQGPRLLVEVSSDGHWDGRPGTGMGARWLDAVAAAPVSIESSAGRTLVRLAF